MAAKKKAALLAVAIAFVASLPAFGSLPKAAAIAPAAVDRYELLQKESQPVDHEAIDIRGMLDRALPGQASLRAIAAARTRESAPAIDALLHYNAVERKSVFTHRSRKLASGPLALRNGTKVWPVRKLEGELHREVVFQALPLFDPFTGMSYARRRWLSHETGMFASPDPLGYKDSSNMYAYCAGDPVNGRDPNGREVSHSNNTFVISDVRPGKRGKIYRIRRDWAQANKIAMHQILTQVGGMSSHDAANLMDSMNVILSKTGPEAMEVIGTHAELVEAGLNDVMKTYAVAATAIATGGAAGAGLATFTTATTFEAGTGGLFAAGLASQGTSDIIDQRFSGVNAYLSSGATTTAVGWAFMGTSAVMSSVLTRTTVVSANISASEMSIFNRPIYYYTDRATAAAIRSGGFIKASDPERMFAVNSAGVYDAGVWPNLDRSFTPNVFTTSVPPGGMTPALAEELGISGRTSFAFQLSPLEMQASGVPIYANPTLANTYNLVAPQVPVVVSGTH